MKFVFLFALLGFSSLAFQAKRPVHIFMIGDSTMANKSEKEEPEKGWGQLLPKFFTEEVKVDNHAQNGRSSKSFISEGRWQRVLDSLKAGDYVIIQFGHNDEKKDTSRATSPRTTYRANLMKFVNETRAKGAFPVLCTSIVRRKFNDRGKLEDTHGEYPVVVRELAKEMHVPLLDMQLKTQKLIAELGPEKSKSLFVYAEPGQYPRFPNGKKDDTHLNEYGATSVAGLALEAMKEQKLELVKYARH